ncbi:unnamed protein product [Effrenium voratum]|uniref:Nudix hydrolase domain-containing protein n=1 Tax=Effrenium voratum TaxID=2562239 RepID=A0AA36IUD2_9DINO|nr:unnamed protein product [Effrenium voratum]CAJ1393687.1 unnamed protein product [Effrenium voratum]CAJ1436828.1 unnamed protein product [Effrenium voratum]
MRICGPSRLFAPLVLGLRLPMSILPGPCRYGIHCVRHDCCFVHPQGRLIDSDISRPRQKNAQVMPGHLATVGGMRDRTDPDSSVTAIREVFEETGLLDVGHLQGAESALQKRAEESGAPAPQRFFKFAEGANVDWWVLLLTGPGLFGEGVDSTTECADISWLLPWLPSAEPACFGHAWLCTDKVNEIPSSVQLMGGLHRRIREAVDALASAEHQPPT